MKACNMKINERHLFRSSRRRPGGDLPNVSKYTENATGGKLYTFSDKAK